MQRIHVHDQDPAQVAMAADAIRAGKTVVLPTETVYGLAADPADARGVERLRALKGRPRERDFTYHLAERGQLEQLAQAPPGPVERLLALYWPGPLTVILPGREREWVGLRVPAQPFTRAVIRGFALGLFLSSVNRSGEPPLAGPDEIAAGVAELDLLFDAGPPSLGIASTVVRWNGRELEVLREGILDRDGILRAAAATVLFVCSGNTCRSPLAAAIARRRLAERLGCDEDDLLRHRLHVASAGTTTLAGVPASEGSLVAAREVGIDLADHRATPLTEDDLNRADVVYCLSSSHRERLLHLRPDLEDRVRLLDPGGRSVRDPFGADLDTYRATRDEVAAAVDERLPEILALREQ